MNGKKWYPFFKPREGSSSSLSEFYTEEDIEDSILVSYSDVDQRRYFTLFQKEDELWNYQMEFPEDKRSFFEVVIANKRRKPYFDVDISDKSHLFELHEEVLTSLKYAICKAIDQATFTVGDIIVYTSHGAKKKSYHVVVDGYFLGNNLSAKAFYERTIEFMTPEYSTVVDKAVYSSLQNFRLYQSQKHSSGRKKILHGDSGPPTFEKFMQSLLTNTGGCQELEQFSTVSKKIKRVPIDTSEAKILRILSDYLKRMKISCEAFSLESSTGGLFLLRRNMPTYCEKCKRVHDNENPFLTVKKNGEVLLYCRRGERGIVIGEAITRISSGEALRRLCANRTVNK